MVMRHGVAWEGVEEELFMLKNYACGVKIHEHGRIGSRENPHRAADLEATGTGRRAGRNRLSS